MSSCKAIDTSASSLSKILLTSNTQYSDPTYYRQIVGALQYLTFTRPDICYAVNKVCQFMHSPTDGYWSLVKRIVRYFQGMTSYGLHIGGRFFPYMVLQMLIGLVVLMTENPPVAT